VSEARPVAADLPEDWWPEVRPDAARRLMAAAVESFAARGYHATTTRDIATAAGMSPAALYVHFPAKSAVLFAISRSGHERTLALVQTTMANHDDPVDAMRVLIEEFVAWHAKRHVIARVVQHELEALTPADHQVVLELRRTTEGLVRDLVTRGVAAGAFTVPDVRTAARAVLSLGIDVARWYSPTSKPAPEVLGKQYAELVLSMLGHR
jgi:AcrR family transcriptional regulator